MEYKDIVKAITEECIQELYPANYQNVQKLINRSHKQATLLSNKPSEEWTKKDMTDSVKEFKQQEYAEKKFNDKNSFVDKLRYIKETIATMMDVQPIQVVGKEHPAKEEKKKKCQEQ